jgi:2-amino-4-hydroxy-6-hydroxymethyldihydropteridine diphosphokinase
MKKNRNNKKHCGLLLPRLYFCFELIFTMNVIFLSIGSNIGNRSYFLQQAIYYIRLKIGTLSSQSSVYETEPWGFKTNQLFLNQVIKVETKLSPIKVLNAIQDIELKLGRTRGSAFYEPRTVDIDILFFNRLKRKSLRLTIPHPKLHLRNFTMIPLSEIAGEFIHPVFNERLDSIAKKCSDNKNVKIYDQLQMKSLLYHEL